MGHPDDLPNADWVAENHWCVPLYYRPAERGPPAGQRHGAQAGAATASSTRGSAAAVRAPAAGRAVVVGVVQEQDVARRRSVRATVARDRRAAWRGASSRGPSATTAAASSRARGRRAARASE